MVDYQFEWAAVLTPANLATLGSGLLVTVGLAALSGALALAIGLAIALLRYSSNAAMRTLASLYVEVFRNIPALVSMLGLSFAVPLLLPAGLRRSLLFDNAAIDAVLDATGIHLYYAAALVLALALNTAAYLAEIYRAGFENVDPIQVDAARATGLTKSAILRLIVLPQGLRLSSPPAATRMVHNLKNTALAIFVPVPDFFSAVQSVISRTFRGVETVTIGVAVYLLLSWASAALLARGTRSAGAGLKRA